MTRAASPLVETGLLIAAGFLAVQLVMLPLGTGRALGSPDLLFCLIVGWVVRRPDAMVLPVVVGLGLYADLMLSRPIGLGTIGLVLVVEMFRSRARVFRGAPFLVEWAAAVVAFALMLAAMSAVLSLVLLGPPGLGPLLRHVTATAIAYPLVVLGLTWCLGVRAGGRP